MSVYIYKDYEVEDILFDTPCNVMKCGQIYPVKIKDYKEFNKYTKYLIFSPEHLKLKNNSDLLKSIVMLNLVSLNEETGITMDNTEGVNSNLLKILKELENLFSIITRKIIKVNLEVSAGYVFTSNDNSVVISDYNFNEVRKVMMKQNLIHEPKIFEHELTRKWAEKAKRARLKKSPPTPFPEIINIVRNELKISYSDIQDLNLLQLYADYSRICNTKHADTITLFRTVTSDPKKLPKVEFTDSVIEKLFKNPDETLFKEDTKLNDVLGKA